VLGWGWGRRRSLPFGWDLMGEPSERVAVTVEATPERLRVEGSF
jgi:hypothetical protein